MNSVNLIGRLTRDPEMRYTQGGQAVCNFTLAIDKGLSKEKQEEFKAQNKPTADFINIVAWGKTGEIAGKYLGKGRLAGVSGSLQSGSYEKDGITRYTTDVNCFRLDILEWPDDNKQSSNDPVEDFHPIDNNDIPF